MVSKTCQYKHVTSSFSTKHMADVPDVDVKLQARNTSYSIRGRLSFSVGLEDINIEAKCFLRFVLLR